MGIDPDHRRRRGMRLQGYDYSQAGAYFVTLCTQGRASVFGAVADDVMRLNEAGVMVDRTWAAIADHYPGVDVDAFVLMPNHLHGILLLHGDGAETGPMRRDDQGQARGPAPTGTESDRMRRDAVGAAPRGRPSVGDALSLGDVVQRFKTLTTRLYIAGVRGSGWAAFPGRLWQRNYYEHIIRDDASLNRIRQYIHDNPARWALDPENTGA